MAGDSSGSLRVVDDRSGTALWLLMPVVYLGAFASGIRPGARVGSRLLPLLAAMIPAVWVYKTSWLAGLPVLGLLSAAFINDILLEVTTRDF